MEQLLLALRFYAARSMLILCADFSGTHVSTASRVMTRVSEAIAQLAPTVIKFPETQEEIMMLKNNVFEIARFPNVVGAIDCTHAYAFSPAKY